MAIKGPLLCIHEPKTNRNKTQCGLLYSAGMEVPLLPGFRAKATEVV